jgi:hypothetical protein
MFFNDAPIDQCFEDDNIRIPVKTSLENLKNSFLEVVNPDWKPNIASTQPGAPKSKHRSYPDDIEVIHWNIKDKGKIDWNISWTFFCRSKVMGKAATCTDSYRDNCTKLLPHAVVYKKPTHNNGDPKQWLAQR